MKARSGPDRWLTTQRDQKHPSLWAFTEHARFTIPSRMGGDDDYTTLRMTPTMGCSRTAQWGQHLRCDAQLRSRRQAASAKHRRHVDDISYDVASQLTRSVAPSLVTTFNFVAAGNQTKIRPQTGTRLGISLAAKRRLVFARPHGIRPGSTSKHPSAELRAGQPAGPLSRIQATATRGWVSETKEFDTGFFGHDSGR